MFKSVSQQTKKRTYGWFLVVLGASMVIWVIFSIYAYYNYLYLDPAARTAVVAGESEIVTTTATKVMFWLWEVFWCAIGAGALYAGVRKVRRKATSPA